MMPIDDTPSSLAELLEKYGMGGGLSSTLIAGLLQGQTDPRNIPGGGKGFGGTASGNPRDLIMQIARKASKRGFNVGGLEGYKGMGQISSGHVDNSQHYSGLAADITQGTAGRSLSWLEHQLMKKYGDALTELFYGGNRFNPSSVDPTHMGHLHVGTRPGG